MTSAPRRRAYARGHHAERVAAWLLRLKAYKILARRYKVGGGEIDIVARRGATIAFVEVKYRPSIDEALFAVTTGQTRRVSQAARIWLAAHPATASLIFRGDAICLAPWRRPRHLPGAFTLDLG